MDGRLADAELAGGLGLASGRRRGSVAARRDLASVPFGLLQQEQT